MPSTEFYDYQSGSVLPEGLSGWNTTAILSQISGTYTRVGTAALGECFQTGWGECYNEHATSVNKWTEENQLAVTVFFSAMAGFMVAMMAMWVLYIVFTRTLRLFSRKTVTVEVPRSAFKAKVVDPIEALRTVLREEIGAEAQMTTFQRHMLLEMQELRKALLANTKGKNQAESEETEDEEIYLDESSEDSSDEDVSGRRLTTRQLEEFQNTLSEELTACGTAYYMEKSVREQLDTPECTQICTYSTKRKRAGGLCPSKAVYIHYLPGADSIGGEPLVECYCQQHFISLNKKGGINTAYRKRDHIPVPENVISMAKMTLMVEGDD